MEHVEEELRAGRKPTDDARYLAGLTGVRHLYVDPANRDIILEGPGEDKWELRGDKMVVGSASGQPLLQLDDFAVAWRNAVDGAPPPSVSLEHRQESIQRMQAMIRGTPQPTSAAARQEYTRKLQEAWGPQDAVTGGVPTQTRFNKVMVDADWEMKRISLGLTEPGVANLPTYVDLEFEDFRRRVTTDGLAARKPEGGSRFWFFPAYTEFAHTEKFDAVAIPPNPVQLLTESHFRNISQGKQVLQEPTPAAKLFVEAFTKNYMAIAAANPIYLELRNLFDWVAIARLIRLLDIPRRIGWDLAFLHRGYPVRELSVPREMPGQVALRHAEVRVAQGLASLVFPARGGVSIDCGRVMTPERLRRDASLEQRRRDAVRRPPTRRPFWS